MEFLVPSLLMLILAGLIVFLVVPRVSYATIFIFSLLFLVVVGFNHYQMFAHDYAVTPWRDYLKNSAQPIMIAVIVIGVIVAFMNLLTGLDIKLTLPKWVFKASNNTKRISNVEGYSEIPLSRIREIERNL